MVAPHLLKILDMSFGSNFTHSLLTVCKAGSCILKEIWPLGHCEISGNFQSKEVASKGSHVSLVPYGKQVALSCCNVLLYHFSFCKFCKRKSLMIMQSQGCNRNFFRSLTAWCPCGETKHFTRSQRSHYGVSLTDL